MQRTGDIRVSTQPTLIVRITEHGGEPMLDAIAMSLLFGVELADIHALPGLPGGSPIPREWIQRGRRRAAEARAHTGSSGLLDSRGYWARKDHGAELAVVYE
jgi:hypothetical protein